MSYDCLTCMVLVLVVSLDCLICNITGTIINLEQGDHLLTSFQAFGVGTWGPVAVKDVYITNLVLLVVLRHLNYVSIAHILFLGLGNRDFIPSQVVRNNEVLQICLDSIRSNSLKVLFRVFLRERCRKVIKLYAILLLLLFLALIVNNLVT